MNKVLILKVYNFLPSKLYQPRSHQLHSHTLQNRQCQGLGVRGIGVGADSPLPPMHSVEATLPLTTQPLHYAASTPDVVDVSQEFKSLPGKLSSVAAPILATAVCWFTVIMMVYNKCV